MSTFLAGVFLLILMLVLGDTVGRIPMAALVAVMFMVSFHTVDWHSVRTLRRMPLSETVVMLVTVIGTLATDNLAVGVILGVLTATVAFARRVAHLVSVELEGNVYTVRGQLFFASSNDLVYAFDYTLPVKEVIVDFSRADIWDASTVAVLDSVESKYAARGVTVSFRGLDAANEQRYRRLSQGLRK